MKALARAFGLELARRWPTLLAMVLLPMAYFFITYLTAAQGERIATSVVVNGVRQTLQVDDRAQQALYLAVLGIGVSAAFAALTSLRGRTPTMRRLRLIGFTSAQLLGARLIVLTAAVVVATLIFTGVLLPLVALERAALGVLALLAVGLIGVALGSVLGVLTDREFEPAMVIIFVFGMQLALGRGGSPAEAYLPLYPAVRALLGAAFSADAAVWPYLGQSIGYAAALLGAALLVWHLRTRVWPVTASQPQRQEQAS